MQDHTIRTFGSNHKVRDHGKEIKVNGNNIRLLASMVPRLVGTTGHNKECNINNQDRCRLKVTTWTIDQAQGLVKDAALHCLVR